VDGGSGILPRRRRIAPGRRSHGDKDIQCYHLLGSVDTAYTTRCPAEATFFLPSGKMHRRSGNGEREDFVDAKLAVGCSVGVRLALPDGDAASSAPTKRPAPVRDSDGAFGGPEGVHFPSEVPDNAFQLIEVSVFRSRMSVNPKR
jgi:hypothetical protein